MSSPLTGCLETVSFYWKRREGRGGERKGGCLVKAHFLYRCKLLSQKGSLFSNFSWVRERRKIQLSHGILFPLLPGLPRSEQAASGLCSWEELPPPCLPVTRDEPWVKMNAASLKPSLLCLQFLKNNSTKNTQKPVVYIWHGIIWSPSIFGDGVFWAHSILLSRLFYEIISSPLPLGRGNEEQANSTHVIWHR